MLRLRLHRTSRAMLDTTSGTYRAALRPTSVQASPSRRRDTCRCRAQLEHSAVRCAPWLRCAGGGCLTALLLQVTNAASTPPLPGHSLSVGTLSSCSKPAREGQQHSLTHSQSPGLVRVGSCTAGRRHAEQHTAAAIFGYAAFPSLLCCVLPRVP